MARSGLLSLGALGFGSSWRRRRLGARATLALVASGPLFALATAFVLSGANDGPASTALLRAVLLADLVYVLSLVGLILVTVARAIAARRARSAGSKLHLRLAGLFTLVALAPTVLVAVFATLTVNFGLEAWFSNQVRTVLGNALAVAEAYENEHRGTIRGDALAMANDLNHAASLGVAQDALADVVRQQSLLRELPESYVLNGEGQILARGEFSYLFTLDPPTPEEFEAARAGRVVLIDDEDANEMRALVNLTGYVDAFLYITRRVDGEVLALLDETRETVALYDRLERERAHVLFDFALLYLGFAALVILAAIWLGLWFAERLARPIGRLAGAAERVGAGDLDLRVEESEGDDEVALLGRVFNRMTAQVKRQRDALLDANRDSERRRRFIETVLSGVSAGVIGLDSGGRVELVNDAAAEMLALDRRAVEGRPLAHAAPALAGLLGRAAASPAGAAQDQIRLAREGRERELMARITPKGADRREGSVLTIDDMTELVSAQRLAAWGDVARRIAHEIKNPLTPIQLSADRLRSKFAKLPEPERASLAQYADVISRQADGIRRMVDEFSRFARMPEPERACNDLGDILREAVLLQRAAETGIEFRLVAPEDPVRASCDRAMLGQALTNLLKNAGEAAQARMVREAAPAPGIVEATLRVEPGGVAIEIADNGVGLPAQDRARLTEPYVTTRAKGAGLGLAIVKKIVEQHGGALELTDAPPFPEGGGPGAMARIFLPVEGLQATEERLAG